MTRRGDTMDEKKGSKKERGSFSGQIGFIFAASASAVGLGNIWRFPYLAAEYGGGIFLLVYAILLVTFGFTLMVAELAIGRKTGVSAINAVKVLDKRFSFLGVLASLVPVIILPYYCVIGGWVLKYLGVFLTGNAVQAADDTFFTAFIAQPVEPLIWLFVVVVLTFVCVFIGVEKGIEKASKILMPLLILLSIVIAVYSITRPGGWEGVLYYITPDFSRFSINTVIAALGQLFFSLSLAMGIMITYGSYLKKEANLLKSVKRIEFLDAGVAFLAGLMIVPAVFAFSGGDPDAMNAGAGLMFITLPKVFVDMQAATLIGTIFFLLVAFAVLTSSVSLMETIVSIFIDRFGWSRKFTCIVVAIGCFALAIPSSLGYGLWGSITPLGLSFLDFFDFISNTILMPIVAFFTCIFVGYILKPKTIIKEVSLSAKFDKSQKLFVLMIKYIAPIFLVIIFLSKILEAAGLLVL